MKSHRSVLVRFAIASYRWLNAFGVDPRRTVLALRGLSGFIRDAWRFCFEPTVPGFHFARGTVHPCLTDRHAAAGTAGGSYFHQDIWAARHIFHKSPRRHIDVGSRVDGFVAHVACFRKIEIFDIRPLETLDANILFHQADVMNHISPEQQGCCDSLSCLHALEHFGLGRYGDPVRSDGFLRGWDNLFQILEVDGTLYFSVPLGPARIEFNAHRVFSTKQLRRLIEGRYDIREFAYVDDTGKLHRDRSLYEPDADHDFGCLFGCALLALRKRTAISETPTKTKGLWS